MIKILSIDNHLDDRIKAMVSNAFPQSILYTANNGQTGLKLAAANDPDVILLDILMPGLDGFEICKNIKADSQLRDIPVVLVGAIKDNQEFRIRALKCGIDALLAKPIDELELIIQIQAMVKIKAANIAKHTINEQLKKLVDERTRDLKQSQKATKKLLEDLKKENKEKKQREKELFESEQRYRSLFTDSRDAIMTLSIEQGFLSANPATIQMFGCSNEADFISRTPASLSPEIQPDGSPSIEKSIEMMNKALEQGYSFFEWMHRRVDHSEFMATVLLSRLSTGDARLLQATVRDITNIKQAEIWLKESEMLLQSTFDQSPVGTALVDLNKQFIKCNTAFCQFLGYTEDELLGKDISLITFHEDREIGMNELKQIVAGEIRTSTHQKRYQRKDGSVVWGEVSISLGYDAENQPLFFIPIVNDINDRKKAEQELIYAKEKAEQSDRLKTAFLQNMSHEIRTPMNSIMGFASLLPDEEDKNTLTNFSNIIYKNSEQLVHVIDDIFLYSQLQNKQFSLFPKEFNANMLINEVQQIFNLPEFHNGIDLKAEMPVNDSITICSDYEKIRQILTNLISNAYKYTLKGAINYGIRRKENELIFFVKDTGIGIPKNEMEHIFDRFYRAGNFDKSTISGTGLGLSIVKELIELLGGNIWAESTEGIGSTFYFTLPQEG